MKNLFARFIRDESGATAIEYGLIASGVSIVILATLTSLGSNLNAKFGVIRDALLP